MIKRTSNKNIRIKKSKKRLNYQNHNKYNRKKYKPTMIKRTSNKNLNKQSNKKKKTVQIKKYRTNSKNPQTLDLKTRKTNPKTNSQYQMSENLLHNNKQNK